MLSSEATWRSCPTARLKVSPGTARKATTCAPPDARNRFATEPASVAAFKTSWNSRSQPAAKSFISDAATLKSVRRTSRIHPPGAWLRNYGGIILPEPCRNIPAKNTSTTRSTTTAGVQAAELAALLANDGERLNPYILEKKQVCADGVAA